VTVIAFDNSGTLSEVTVASEPLAPGYDWLETVPAADRGRFGLFNVESDFERLRSDEPLGAALEDDAVTLRLALANCEVDEADIVLESECQQPARTLVETADRAADRAASTPASDPPRGIQLVVDLADGTAVRAVGYTAAPLPEALEVVAWVREQGYEPHIVSGDAPKILETVAERVGIPTENVHALQSAHDKRRTLEALGQADPTVMIGDYVNDRYAFEVADLGVLIDGNVGEGVRSRVDATVDGLSEVPEVLQERAPVLREGRS